MKIRGWLFNLISIVDFYDVDCGGRGSVLLAILD